jgi:hypothetical protein
VQWAGFTEPAACRVVGPSLCIGLRVYWLQGASVIVRPARTLEEWFLIRHGQRFDSPNANASPMPCGGAFCSTLLINSESKHRVSILSLSRASCAGSAPTRTGEKFEVRCSKCKGNRLVCEIHTACPVLTATGVGSVVGFVGGIDGA